MKPSAVPLPPEHLAGCQVTNALSDKAYRALDPSGRSLVLKRVPLDCLQGEKFHPAVHQRLLRIQELAHPGVANLHGVERDGSAILAIWDYLPGQPIDTYFRPPDESSLTTASAPSADAFAQESSERRFIRIARELILLVQSLHRLGLVHGSLSAGNVIVDSTGQVRLTDLSPLLFDDPAMDERALRALLLAIAPPDLPTPLRQALSRPTTLANLSACFADQAARTSTTPTDEPPPPEGDGAIRWATIALAAAVALLGLAIAWVFRSR